MKRINWNIHVATCGECVHGIIASPLRRTVGLTVRFKVWEQVWIDRQALETGAPKGQD